jgi:tetratricopeptide (TPR) repeat protein
VLAGPVYRASCSGARSSSPTKYLDDAETLVAAYEACAAETHPDHDLRGRYAYYAAQSFKDAGDHVRAALWYARRSNDRTGYAEERAHAHLQLARLIAADVERCKDLDLEQVAAHFIEAYRRAPHRAEALFDLSRLYRLAGEPHLALVYAAGACAVREPTEGLFVETWIYQWGAWDELACASFDAGRWETCAQVCAGLLDVKGRLPDAERDRVKANMNAAILRLPHVKIEAPLDVEPAEATPFDAT